MATHNLGLLYGRHEAVAGIGRPVCAYRLREATSQTVTFSYKDYRDGGATKSMTLNGE